MHFLGVEETLLGFIIGYRINFSQSFSNTFLTTVGVENLVIFFLVSFVYFLLDSYFSLGIGMLFFSKRTIPIYDDQKLLFLRKSLERSFIKSIPPLNLLDFLYVLRGGKLQQRLFDKRNDLIVISYHYHENTILKWRLTRFIGVSSLLYYFTFFSAIFVTYLGLGPNSNSTSFSFSWHINNSLFLHILNNNLSLSLLYALGGLTLFAGSGIQLVSSNFLEGGAISSIIHSSGLNAFTYTILPQFIPETFAYVISITCSLVIVEIIISILVDFVFQHSERNSNNVVKKDVYYLLTLFPVMIILLIIAAAIESAL